MPAVSVIIPAYNQARYLDEAIRSVLAQTCPDLEIVVVDDGSTDNTPEVAQQHTDPRLRYIRQENQGLSAARNTGIRHARARYLTYLDSDDLFMPAKLSLLMAEIERSPAAGLVAGQAIPIDDAGNKIGHIFDQPLPDDPEMLLLGNPLHVGSILLRREWQERVGFFDTALRSYEDWDMWLRLARAGCPMRSIAQPVSLYRFHSAQMTRHGAQMTNASFAVLDKVYRDDDLPHAWRALRSRAYSRANLRAAAQDYLAANYPTGANHLIQAVAQDDSLLADDAARLAAHLSAWSELPKVGDRVSFLESVYEHLPPELDLVRSRKRYDLGRAAMQSAFEAYQRGDLAAARIAVQRAFRYDPRWLANRGAVAVFVRSSFPLQQTARSQTDSGRHQESVADV